MNRRGEDYRDFMNYDLKIPSAQKRKHNDVTTILQKIQRIRETTAYLRINLEREREELERARWRANSFYSYPPPTLQNVGIPMRTSFAMYPEHTAAPPPLPPAYMQPMQPPPYFYNPVQDWHQFAAPQHPACPILPYGYSITMPEPALAALPAPRYVQSPIPDSYNYMNVLNDVDRQCKDELANMKTNLRSIRRLGDSWRDTETAESCTSVSSDSGDYVERRVRRRFRRKIVFRNR